MYETYSFEGALEYYGQIPDSVNLDEAGYIRGTLGPERARPSAWPEPPHVSFANSPEEPSAAVVFTKRYGPLIEASFRAPDGWSEIGPNGISAMSSNRKQELTRYLRDRELPVEGSFSFRAEEFFQGQALLRLAWRGEQTALFMLRDRLKITDSDTAFFPDPRLRQILIRTPDLWKFVVLAFLIDYDMGRAKICANARCAKPYFLQQRVDQECCSHSCAVQRNNARRPGHRGESGRNKRK